MNANLTYIMNFKPRTVAELTKYIECVAAVFGKDVAVKFQIAVETNRFTHNMVDSKAITAAQNSVLASLINKALKS